MASKFSLIASSATAFFRKMRAKSPNPVDPIPRTEPHDVLLSVWNVFRNQEQRAGFVKNGLSVHWIGNRRPPISGEVHRRSFGWSSMLASMLSLVGASQTGTHASMWLFNLFSGTTHWNARLVWAYADLNLLLLKRAKKRGVPVVLDNPIAHMDDYYALKSEFEACGQAWPDWRIRRWVAAVKREYELADWFNVGSHFVKNSLVARGIPAERVIVNHTGVDVARWSECRRRRISTGKTVFVATSSVYPRKGIRQLLLAWKKAELREAELWLVGGSRRSMDWERVCGGLPGNVRFYPRCGHDRLSDIYSKCDVYVLPSLLEGLARTGLEAMASGLPVIVTRETGLTDFVTDGIEGWIVPARDPDALADRLRWCASNPDAVKAAGNAAFKRMQGHGLDAYGAQCATIAKAVIAGMSPPLELPPPPPAGDCNETGSR